MPSFKQIVGAVVGFAALATALPVMPTKLISRGGITSRAANPATGLPDGLTDVDVLQLYVALHPLPSNLN